MKSRKLLVKVCGMRDAEDCCEVGRLLPDFMGFIFYPHSPRYVGDTFKVPHCLPRSVLKVGVFVDEEINTIIRLCSQHRLDAVQLHGQESPEICRALKKNLGVEIIKAFAVSKEFDFNRISTYKNTVDYFLFDAKGKETGGNGKVFDWKLLKNYTLTVPFLLSGGLNSSNLSLALAVTHPGFAGVDMNSGFELKPGLKNIKALQSAFAMLRKS